MMQSKAAFEDRALARVALAHGRPARGSARRTARSASPRLSIVASSVASGSSGAAVEKPMTPTPGERERERGRRAGVRVGPAALPHAGGELARRRGVHRPRLRRSAAARPRAGSHSAPAQPSALADRRQQRGEGLGLARRPRRARGRPRARCGAGQLRLDGRAVASRRKSGRPKLLTLDRAAREGTGRLRHDGCTSRSACVRRRSWWRARRRWSGAWLASFRTRAMRSNDLSDDQVYTRVHA